MSDADSADLPRRLSAFVAGEAHRVLSAETLAADPARLADGWERRFITDSTRLQEVVETYEAAGFEVCADPLKAGEFRDECDDCQVVALLRFYLVYTRRRPTDSA